MWAALLPIVPLLLASAFRWDIPKVVSEVSVPQQLEALGVPLRLRAVKSLWKQDDLASHLIKTFKAAHLYITPPSHLFQPTRELQLTALDPDTFISYTAIFQPNQDGTTTVILGEASLKTRHPRAHPEIPLLPGARDVVTSDVELSKSAFYSTQASAKEVESFYREILVKSGYAEVQAGTYRKDRQQLQVRTRPDKGSLQVMVWLTTTEQP